MKDCNVYFINNAALALLVLQSPQQLIYILSIFPRRPTEIIDGGELPFGQKDRSTVFHILICILSIYPPRPTEIIDGEITYSQEDKSTVFHLLLFGNAATVLHR